MGLATEHMGGREFIRTAVVAHVEHVEHVLDAVVVPIHETYSELPSFLTERFAFVKHSWAVFSHAACQTFCLSCYFFAVISAPQGRLAPCSPQTLSWLEIGGTCQPNMNDKRDMMNSEQAKHKSSSSTGGGRTSPS